MTSNHAIRLVAALIFTGSAAVGDEPDEKPAHVTKTDADWAKQLTREQFQVTRRKATEPAYRNKYASNHARGTYECICCGTPLFSSKTKFESGTGWPSFFQPLNPQTVQTKTDHDLGYPRTEVECSTCDAHLGHVFDDGPPPTGLRYCMNSASMEFIPDAKPKPKPETPKEKTQDPKTSESTPASKTP